MTGSTRVFNYISDRGDTYSVNINEANGRALSFGATTTLFPTTYTQQPRLPVGLKMRYIVARSTSPTGLKRRFWVGSLAIQALLRAAEGQFITRYGDPGEVRWKVTHYGPEVVQYLPTTDTGQDDGTPGLS